jgi:hypothetical protein
MTARTIELAVATLFNWRQNIIVPNVHWGWNLAHEADLIVLRRSGWAIEVEIKVSAANIKADLAKHVDHWDENVQKIHGLMRFKPSLISMCYFAVPEKLADSPDIPERYGIIKIVEHNQIICGIQHIRHVAHICRPAQRNPKARKATDGEARKLAELGAMRIWDLKSHLERRTK